MADHSMILLLLQKLLLSLVTASWLFWLVATLLVFVFFRHDGASVGPNTDSSLSGGSTGRLDEPPVSILKPVKGVDEQAYDNFVSFCLQDYPDFELLFGLVDPADPVIPLIERLQREFPHLPVRLMLTEPFGANRKASSLDRLAASASHEILVISDSDMRVTPDYLRRVVAPLADPAIGLVTCPYRGAEALTFTARLEALHMGVTFLPSVLVARQLLAMRFAMGATMVLRRADLERAGGFAAVADYLADDYQIGLRIWGLGYRIVLSDYVVRCILGVTSFQEQWDREVRWTRTNRANRPVEYPGLLLTFTVPLALALALLVPGDPLGWRLLAASIALRWLLGWIITGCTGDSESRRWLIWLPVRDLLSAMVWAAGGPGRRVSWRGEEFTVESDGRLVSVKRGGEALPPESAVAGRAPRCQRRWP
jgi:ceramide glucosyltransferase